VGGVVMIAIERFRRGGPSAARAIDDVHDIGAVRGALIGVIQCFSLWPGTSRSMASIVGGLVAGLTTRAASDFAFLLGIPTLCAACLYKLLKSHEILLRDIGVPALVTGLVISFVVGWIVIAAFLRFLKRTGLTPFGIYRVALGAVVLWTLL
jgi:undecaprenyl-diphosphatase